MALTGYTTNSITIDDMFVFVKPTPKIARLIFADPATIIYWKDGTKTVVKTMGKDVFSEEAGFMACVAKKVFGGHNQYKSIIRNAERPNQKEE